MMLILASSFVAAVYKHAIAGTVLGTAVVFAMENGNPSTLSIALTALGMSIALKALGVLWQVSERLRSIGMFVLDKWLDRLSERVGMEPGDFKEFEVKTPMDEMAKPQKSKSKPEESPTTEASDDNDA